MELLSFHWCFDEVSLLTTGGLGRFVPCSVGANHCRLRHIGWEKCGHGRTSRPLPLRYCAARFASKVPTWRLPVSGHASSLVTADPRVVDDGEAEVASQGVRWVSRFWTGTEKNSTKQKNPCTPRGFSYSISAMGVEEIASCGVFNCFLW